MRQIDLKSARLLLRIVTGNPVEIMEAAKEIIRSGKSIAPLLAEIAANRKCRKWSRIAATYAFGFIAD